jgi:hypothetical protein
MTDREIDPSLLPDTPPSSQDNTITNAEADAWREVAASAPESGAGGLPDNAQQGSGRPRTQITIYPLPRELRDADPGAADGLPPNGAPTEAASTSGRALSDAWNADDRETVSSRLARMADVDPVHALVEFALPSRTFTDWLLADPLNRGELFALAIAKDPAGVDAASARAHEIGYIASRFTDQLQTLVGVGTANAAIGHSPTAESSGRDTRALDSGVLAKGPFSGPPKPRPLPLPPPSTWPSLKLPESPRPKALPPEVADTDADDDDDIAIWAQFADDPDAEGRILSDERNYALVPGQQYSQRRVTQHNLAITGHHKTDVLTETLLTVLAATAREKGAGSGSRFGIDVHKHFAAKIEKLGLPGVHVEQSYDRRLKIAVTYGEAGTIRTDVAKMEGKKTVAVWDLKTGKAVLRPSRARACGKNGGTAQTCD